MKRRIIFYIMIALIFSTVLAGCKKESTKAKKELLEPVNAALDTAIASYGTLNDVKVYDGEVLPNVVEISFDTEGYLYGLYVSAGDEVEEGRVIASIVGKNFNTISKLEDEIEELLENNKNTLEYLEADVTLAKLNGEDTSELELELKHSIELAELKVEEKQQKLDKLKADDIGYIYVTAPCDCRVIAVSSIRNGGYVGAGTPVCAIEGEGPACITCEYVNEKTVNSLNDYYAVIHGRRYELQYIPYTKEQITEIASAGGTFVSRFTLTDEDVASVTVGDYAAVFTESNYAPNVLIVPINALYSDNTGKYVYEIVDGVRVRRTVVTGLSDSSNIEIVEGLEEGAYVYVKE